jgi:hypothetical protein
LNLSFDVSSTTTTTHTTSQPPKKAERKISTFQVFLFTLPNNPKRLNVFGA